MAIGRLGVHFPIDPRQVLEELLLRELMWLPMLGVISADHGPVDVLPAGVLTKAEKLAPTLICDRASRRRREDIHGWGGLLAAKPALRQ